VERIFPAEEIALQNPCGGNSGLCEEPVQMEWRMLRGGGRDAVKEWSGVGGEHAGSSITMIGVNVVFSFM
jgi:hypothetical protein